MSFHHLTDIQSWNLETSCYDSGLSRLVCKSKIGPFPNSQSGACPIIVDQWECANAPNRSLRSYSSTYELKLLKLRYVARWTNQEAPCVACAGPIRSHPGPKIASLCLSSPPLTSRSLGRTETKSGACQGSLTKVHSLQPNRSQTSIPHIQRSAFRKPFFFAE